MTIHTCGPCGRAHGYDIDTGEDLLDPCLGYIEGAVFACCGHGDATGAYIAIEPGRYDALRAWLDRIKSAGLVGPGDFLHGHPFGRRGVIDTFYLQNPGEENDTIEGRRGVPIPIGGQGG